MSKRGKRQDGAIGALIVLALLYLLFRALYVSVGIVMPVVVFVGIVVLILMSVAYKKKKRLAYLTVKYGDPTVADNIYNKRYWQGQTAEQLLDSLGQPHGIDRKLLKTIKREVWKYNPRGVNRYGLRITLDHDVVTNWEHKG